MSLEFGSDNDCFGFPDEVPVSVIFWQAALDGSGNLDGQHKAVAYAGLVNTQTQWRAHGEAWATILRESDLAYFKMAEAMSWHHEFLKKYREWGDERNRQRDILLRRLASTCRAYGSQLVGAAVEVDQLPIDVVAAKKVDIIKGVLTHMLRGIPPDHRVVVACDREGDVEPRLIPWFKQTPPQEQLPGLAGFCFFDDKFFPQLQCADMIAWLFRNWKETSLARGEIVAAPELLQAMLPDGQSLEQIEQPDHASFYETVRRLPPRT